MGKPSIEITQPFDALIDASEEALSHEESVFAHAGELVSIEGGCFQPLRPSLVRYKLARVADWTKSRGEDDGGEPRLVHPPASVGKCLIDKSSWTHIRPLRAVSAFPPISAEGNVRSEPGYDPESQVYFAGGVEADIPSYPTQQEASTAANRLLHLVIDFPFASAAHRSAWLAALLSPLARFAHNGNSPLIVVQANSPRVGKTTLVKLISYIISGVDCPVITHTPSEDETRKRILSYLRGSRAMVLVDNVVGTFGGAGMNALLTSRIFEDRVLGSNKVLQTVNDTSWCITGNNLSLAPDTAERSQHIRLHTDEEHPNLRADFSHDVFSMVVEKRSQLLSYALTILKAYIRAGLPPQDIPAWGSFEAWSALIRGAIVWSGLPDPAETRAELETEGDENRSGALDLIEGWEELLREHRIEGGLTTREALALLDSGRDIPRLRAAFEEISGGHRLPNAHQIGRRFREIKGRNFGGKTLRIKANDKLGHRWYVSLI
jgi:hypothetical protein